MTDDDFDDAPTVRQRRRGRIVVGAILLLVGVVAAVSTTVINLRDQRRVTHDFVTRAPQGQVLSFRADGGDYTLVGVRDADGPSLGSTTCNGTVNFETSTGWESGLNKTLKTLRPPAGPVSLRCSARGGITFEFVIIKGALQSNDRFLGRFLGGCAVGFVGLILLVSVLIGKRVPRQPGFMDA